MTYYYQYTSKRGFTESDTFEAANNDEAIRHIQTILDKEVQVPTRIIEFESKKRIMLPEKSLIFKIRDWTYDGESGHSIDTILPEDVQIGDKILWEGKDNPQLLNNPDEKPTTNWKNVVSTIYNID